MGKKKKPVPIVPLAAPARAPRRREAPPTAPEPSPAPPQPARPQALTPGRPTLWASHTPTVVVGVAVCTAAVNVVHVVQ